MHEATTLPVDVGYRLCSQTLGSINTSLTDVLCQAEYDYLIPSPPIIDEVDQTFHTSSPRGSGHRGSSFGGSSSRSTRGLERSSTRGRSSRSLSTFGCYVAICSSSFHDHSSTSIASAPHKNVTYQRASQRRASALNVFEDVDESTPSSSTDAHSKRGRGL